MGIITSIRVGVRVGAAPLTVWVRDQSLSPADPEPTSPSTIPRNRNDASRGNLRYLLFNMIASLYRCLTKIYIKKELLL